MSTVDRELARAKLTRTLHIVGRRADGYHLLDSEMVALDFGDELEITEGDGLELRDGLSWTAGDRLAPGESARITSPYTLSEVPIDGGNLVFRALALVGRQAQVRLTKRVPPGAGLGGGSADAAAILRWAALEDRLQAATLGADVPFCLHGGRARVTGIGEQLEELEPEEHTFLLVTPALSVSTAAVYAAYDVLTRKPGIAANDLEPAAIAVEPRLGRWRDFLAEVGGAPPTLAGSGSTFFFECDGQGDGLETEVRQALSDTRTRAQIRLCRTVGRY